MAKNKVAPFFPDTVYNDVLYKFTLSPSLSDSNNKHFTAHFGRN